MFVIAIWMDFDIEKNEEAYNIGLKISALFVNNNFKVNVYSSFKFIDKIEKHFFNNGIFANFLCSNMDGKQINFSRLKEADCWFYPGVFEMKSLPIWVPTIVAICDSNIEEFENADKEFDFDIFGGGSPTRRSFVAGATICVTFSHQMSSVLSKSLAIPFASIRFLDLLSSNAGECLCGIAQEAKAVSFLDQDQRNARCSRPWPLTEVKFQVSENLPEIFLFLPTIYPGGIWQASRDLILDLVEINNDKENLKLTLGVPDDVGDEYFFRQIGQKVLFDRFELLPISPFEAKRMLGNQSIKYDYNFYCLMKGCESFALGADAWFSLTDRFSFPLLPARPYAVMVYDVIQKHAPETFASKFFESVDQGMRPTFQGANYIVTGGNSVRDDVIDFYKLEPDKVKMYPIATDPLARFAGKRPYTVQLPSDHFILQIANIAPHKGIHTALCAQAVLKESMGPSAPLLVICGSGTELISTKIPRSDVSAYVQGLREIIEKNNLKEGRDFICLGFVREEELLDLYKRATIVLNASRYDLGTLCAIEAVSFGKPMVSSRYPAIEEMASRFRLPVRFFRMEDHLDLANQLEIALRNPDLSKDEVLAIRSLLQKSNLSHRSYAEAIYQLLVELGKKGRDFRSSFN